MSSQVRCPVCIDQRRSVSKHCPECKGTTWVKAWNKCVHPKEEYEAMTGGWLCPDCGDSGPL